MDTRSLQYQTYILHLWIEHDPKIEARQCRLRLEHAVSGVQIGFISIADLCIYLSSEVEKMLLT